MRLDKYLANARIGTRSEVRKYIWRGQVAVNGEIVKKPEQHICESTDIVEFDGKRIEYSQYQYYMLNKPAGVITAVSDASEQTVMDLLPENIGKGLSPVGRLDKDAEGLLLITNDGGLAHKLLSPKKRIFKTYYVECAGVVDDAGIEMLEMGVDIGDDKPTAPARVKLMERTAESCIMELSISEGRFHQVKRMVEAVGGRVTYLKRLSIGALELDGTLAKGDFRKLYDAEIKALKELK